MCPRLYPCVLELCIHVSSSSVSMCPRVISMCPRLYPCVPELHIAATPLLTNVLVSLIWNCSSQLPLLYVASISSWLIRRPTTSALSESS